MSLESLVPLWVPPIATMALLQTPTPTFMPSLFDQWEIAGLARFSLSLAHLSFLDSCPCCDVSEAH